MGLREIRIADLAVIADAQLEVGDRFSVLTGETGAGKSLCVAGLRLALGGKVEGDVVRAGADAARVSAVFDDISPTTQARLHELGVVDDELLTLTRELPRSARGACRINGSLVSQAVLREIGESLVEVTAQGASQRLLRRGWQRDVLDAAGGESTRQPRADVEAAVRSWREATAALDAGRRAAHSDAEALQRARDLLADVEPLQLRAGEDDELAGERLRLRHATRIVQAALDIAAAAAGDETGSADALAAAQSGAADLARIDPALQDLTEEATLLVNRLRGLGLDARRHADRVNVDEARLAAVEERLDAIARIKRRHGSIDAALDELERARQLVDAAEGGEGALQRLELAVEHARQSAAQVACALSEARSGAAARLETAITQELRGLEMPQARFRVVLARTGDPDGLDLGDGIPVRCGVTGVDDVDFRLAATRDLLPTPLDEGPSGGELSRLALALSAVVSEPSAPVLVLDEVDTGIGGETAARVGDVLAAIGQSRQVLAVTHRPEIAARASTHLVVTKQHARRGAAATVDSADGHDRVREIARLMSGRTTEAALRRATELLDEGRMVERPPSRGRTAVPTM